VPPTHRRLFTVARVEASASWAHTHGLEPADGPYLVELSARPLTLKQLGEALAIHGQSRQMIGEAVERLILTGFLRIDAAVTARSPRGL
jgi:hypothetical protein